MKIDKDRSDFDAALQDITNVFLLLFGTTESSVPKLHDQNLGNAAYKKTVWVVDSALLKPEEKSWYSSDSHYAMLTNDEATGVWKPVIQGLVSALCQSNGEPDARKVTKAFADAEKAS